MKNLFILLLISNIVYAGQLPPFTGFNSGDSISSTEVNSRFDQVRIRANTTPEIIGIFKSLNGNIPNGSPPKKLIWDNPILIQAPLIGTINNGEQIVLKIPGLYRVNVFVEGTDNNVAYLKFKHFDPNAMDSIELELDNNSGGCTAPRCFVSGTKFISTKYPNEKIYLESQSGDPSNFDIDKTILIIEKIPTITTGIQ